MSNKYKILFEQLFVFFVYSISVVFAKMASGNEFLSKKFILLYAVQILSLAIYAVLWQGCLKKTSLSKAFSNKAVTIIFGLIFGLVLFNEHISLFQIVGVGIVMIGIRMVNSDE